MPKIKIRGYAELIDVSQELALKAKRLKFDEEAAGDSTLDLGSVIVEKNDIRAVFLDSELQRADLFEARIREYYASKDKWRALSSAEKAQKVWLHFNLFCYSIGVLPTEDLREKVEQVAEQFFGENPLRTIVDYELYYDVLGVDRDIKADSFIKRFLEQVEGTDRSEERANSTPISLGVFGTHDPNDLY